MRRIDQWLARQADFQPNKAAIIYDSGASKNPSIDRYQLTYSELNQRVNKTAYLLQHHWQLQIGDRISWLGLNHPDMFVLLFAASKIGAIVVPLNWRLSVDELTHIIRDSRPNLIFHDRQHQVVSGQLADAIDKSAVTIELPDPGTTHTDILSSESSNGQTSLSTELNNLSADSTIEETSSQVSAESPLLLVYTSGTTGRPKGAVLPHRVMACNAVMSQHMYDLTAADRVLNVLPLFHVGGINIQPLPALMYGATVILHNKFDPNHAVHTLNSDNITLVNTVPTLLQAIMETDAWRTTPLTNLKSVSIGSTDVPVQLIEAVHQKNIPLVQVYGATETGPIAIYQRVESAKISAGSIGKAGLLCEIKLVNSSGDTVATNEPGEICVRGDNILSHYWNNSKASVDSIIDGWFHTGDVATVDDQGDYWFNDRIKHVIISGGENIYPAEIERVIREIKGVLAVSVVGITDEHWGEIPVALVVTDGSGVDRQTVIDYCQLKLAKFKIPKLVQFAKELPRNAMGKVVISDVRSIMSKHSGNQ